MSLHPSSRDPLRILMILRAPIGGLYRHVIDLSHQLIQRGHHVGIVMDKTIEDPQTMGRIDAMSAPPSLGVFRIPMPRVIGPGDLTASFKIRSIANKLNIDVLHGHGAKGGLSARISRFMNKDRVAIYTPHGGVLHYAPNSILGVAFRLVERMLLLSTDATTFESAYAKRAFESQISDVKCLAPVVLNGLAPHEFDPMDPKLAEYDFSYVGELREIKGIDVLLRALAQVKRSDGTPASLILGGGGPDEQMLKELTQSLDLQEQVSFVGVQPARDVFSKGRVAVMPSLGESLPYVCLEASAGGRPLIATHVGGVSEIFGPTADRLVAAGDVQALRVRLQQAIDDPAAETSEADERLKHVQSIFTLETMTDGIENAYYDALALRKQN